jgi:pimeloyl-ACP methyl ester carboxylesterase
MNHSLRFLTVLLFTTVALLPGRAAEATPTPVTRTYVLVHGASGGGWDWKTVDRLLTANGHTVYRPTLTGLGERAHLANPEINLTTHINDIVNVILFEELHEVVLVGHSYGGMVITGVMDRIPARLSHVIFLDAAVPGDGQSMEDFRGALSSQHKVIGGQIHFSWLNPSQPAPRDVPQSYKTFTEPVFYRNPAAKLLPVTYVPFISPGQSVEQRSGDSSWLNAKARGWTIRTLASDHNAQRNHPKELVALLQEALKDRNQP